MNSDLRIYGLYDVKADAVTPHLFLFANDELAKRGFKSIFINSQGFENVATYPDDFYVVGLGFFDQAHEGIVTGCDPVRVCCLADLKENHNG